MHFISLIMMYLLLQLRVMSWMQAMSICRWQNRNYCFGIIGCHMPNSLGSNHWCKPRNGWQYIAPSHCITVLPSLAEILVQDLVKLQGYVVLFFLHQKLALNLLERVMNHMILHHDHAWRDCQSGLMESVRRSSKEVISGEETVSQLIITSQ